MERKLATDPVNNCVWDLVIEDVETRRSAENLVTWNVNAGTCNGKVMTFLSVAGVMNDCGERDRLWEGEETVLLLLMGQGRYMVTNRGIGWLITI